MLSLHHVVVDSVFDVTRRVWRTEEPLVVGLVLREQQRNVTLTVEIPFTQIGVRCGNCLTAFLA